ncbi:MAG: FadR family transcriptional regulator [Candidatus Hydrogenedentes bacterium]|nr:FadR family transcriptional regulator [Candidatus Hydrogenedentota bacterium]
MRRILSGEYGVGEKIPSERELSAEFDITRNAVREALKRLEALGLVRTWRGSGVYVQNPQLSAGIELFDALITQEDGTPNLALLKDVLEFRANVVRFIVRLAAARRTEEELRRIRDLIAERSRCKDDPDRLVALAASLFHEIAYAAHNVICQLMFNTVEQASLKLRTIVDYPVLGFEQAQDIFERLLDAFERQDSDLAELIAIRYVEVVQQVIEVQTGATAADTAHSRPLRILG